MHAESVTVTAAAGAATGYNPAHSLQPSIFRIIPEALEMFTSDRYRP